LCIKHTESIKWYKFHQDFKRSEELRGYGCEFYFNITLVYKHDLDFSVQDVNNISINEYNIKIFSRTSITVNVLIYI